MVKTAKIGQEPYSKDKEENFPSQKLGINDVECLGRPSGDRPAAVDALKDEDDSMPNDKNGSFLKRHRRPFITATVVLVTTALLASLVGWTMKRCNSAAAFNGDHHQPSSTTDTAPEDRHQDDATAALHGIQYATIVVSNVTIGTLSDHSFPEEEAEYKQYWMSISNLESFSFFDAHNLVLYLTRSPTPILPSLATLETSKQVMVRPDDFRLANFVSETYPYPLPLGFDPSDYKAVLLTDESNNQNQDGDATDGQVAPKIQISTAEFTPVL